MIEMFKIYKTVVSIMYKDLVFDDVSSLFGPDDSIYIYAIIGLEIPSFILMILQFVRIRKMIKEYDRAEFDLIRENFTTDFHKKIN
jgi:signal transduction histidine kinase